MNEITFEHQIIGAIKQWLNDQGITVQYWAPKILEFDHHELKREITIKNHNTIHITTHTSFKHINSPITDLGEAKHYTTLDLNDPQLFDKIPQVLDIATATLLYDDQKKSDHNASNRAKLFEPIDCGIQNYATYHVKHPNHSVVEEVTLVGSQRWSTSYNVEISYRSE